MVERFDMSFRNKRVRVYVKFLLPLAAAAILLSFILPIELQAIPAALMMIGLAGYYIWVLVDKRKQKNKQFDA